MRRIVVVVATLAVLAVGCGGGRQSPPAVPTPSPPAAQTPSPPAVSTPSAPTLGPTSPGPTDEGDDGTDDEGAAAGRDTADEQAAAPTIAGS